MTDNAYDYRRIFPRGTIPVECGASGDCLFQSFAYALGDKSGTLHLDLRQWAMEHLSANLADHEETAFTLSDDNNPLNAQTFINEMSIPGTHGNELCVQLLANVTERRVRVFSRHFDNDALGGFYTYDPLIYVPEHDPTIVILHLDLGDGVGHINVVVEFCQNPRQFQNWKITQDIRQFQNHKIMQTDSTNSNDSNVIVEPSPVPNFIPANVCIICDGFIIGTEKVCKLTPNQISQHRRRLSFKAYESYYGHELKPELRKQYQVNNTHLKDLLLSPRSRKYKDGYVTCERCAIAMRSNLIRKITPPKFAMQMDLLLDHFHQKLNL